MRDMIFLSHANPEDNEFTMWLTLHLAREGYPVWCDLTKLLGGEDFWKDAEKAIRKRTVKFIYVVSRISNEKDGPLKEVRIADNVRREHNFDNFIIPVLIDDLSQREINVEVCRLNVIMFNEGWPEGLRRLLKRLREDKVVKKRNFTAGAVASWWNTEFAVSRKVLNKKEDYLSNWFPIAELPELLYFHRIGDYDKGNIKETYPVLFHGDYIISFAKAKDLRNDFGKILFDKGSFCVETQKFLEEDYLCGNIDRRQATDFVSQLLRLGWENMMRQRGFCEYSLTDKANIFGFTEDLSEQQRISCEVDGMKISRGVTGYKSYRKKGEIIHKRVWHFAIGAKPILYPLQAYIIRSHVLFSNDGQNIWQSKERMHQARRSQCKHWWNDDWRDRMLVTMNYLTLGDNNIKVSLGRKVTIKVSSWPVTFESPVSYTDPLRRIKPALDYVEEEEYSGDVIDEDDE